eukprot:7028947-Alexandrium_andersonii.AAC.1
MSSGCGSSTRRRTWATESARSAPMSRPRCPASRVGRRPTGKPCCCNTCRSTSPNSRIPVTTSG